MQMPLSSGVVMSMVPHRVCHTYLLAKTPHLSIDKRSKNHVPVRGHNLVRKQFDLMKIQCFTKELFKGSEISFLAKDFRP